MENSQKRILLNITYYTLISFGIISSVLFILKIAFSNLPLYIQIIYYIWSGLLILYLIFDVFCTIKKVLKFVSGIILFVLAILCVIMAVDVFFMQGVSLKGISTLEISYFINMSLSFMPIYLSFFAYIFGEKLVNF